MFIHETAWQFDVSPGPRCSQRPPASRSRCQIPRIWPWPPPDPLSEWGTSESRAAGWLRPASTCHASGRRPWHGVRHRGSGMSVADQSRPRSMQSSPSTSRAGWPITMRTASQSAAMLGRSSGAVSFQHRFGSAIYRDVHLHACVTDGMFERSAAAGDVRFHAARPLSAPVYADAGFMDTSGRRALQPTAFAETFHK